MLRDVSERDLSVTVLGTEMPAPVMLAPIGVQSIVDPEGELAVARAAAALGLPMVLSTVSSFTLEEVAAATAPDRNGFSYIWPRSREFAASLVGRAERAGYEAIVLTVDTFLQGWKPRDLQARLACRSWTGSASPTTPPTQSFASLLDKPPDEDQQAAIGQFIAQFSNPQLNWDDVEFLRAETELPILIKGILHPGGRGRRPRARGRRGDRLQPRRPPGRRRDRRARRAAGGRRRGRRRSRGAPRQRRALRRRRVQGAGAGRRRRPPGSPILWGLALGGEAGALAVLRSVLAELDLTIGLSGHRDPG